MKYGDCSEKDALKTNSSLLMGNKVSKTFHLNYFGNNNLECQVDEMPVIYVLHFNTI